MLNLEYRLYARYRPAAFVALMCTSPTTLASHPLEEVTVQGQRTEQSFPAASSSITAGELDAINFTTLEDAVAHEPSLVVRRRYIGDPNGTLGIRGANMFQTPRSQVYADGLPLHYHLQSRFAGAPRWSLIAPDETEQVEVLYGPFSAEYSGNAMGGVVNISTNLPTERRVVLESALFRQLYDEYGSRDNLDGHRLFAAYGDQFGDVSLYAFYNRLRNDSQPLTTFAAAPAPATGGETPVSGAIADDDKRGQTALYYGDSGSEASTTELYKFKLGFQPGDFQWLGTLAYEERQQEQDRANSYLRDGSGAIFWSGDARQNDQGFAINGGNFQDREQQRRSLLLGLGVNGPLFALPDWKLQLNVSHFTVLEDEERRSNRNPADPAFDGSGRVTTFDDTGWDTLDAVISSDTLGTDDALSVRAGLHLDRYQLTLEPFNSSDYRSGLKSSARAASGGETRTRAAFVQGNWSFAEGWDLGLGARYEHWQSRDGFFGPRRFADRTEETLSPKLTLGFAPGEHWRLRYSTARAFRFPIVEELYQNSNTAASVQVANADLDPEDGIHHNLLIERLLDGGVARLNLYHESVRATIFNQLGLVEGVELSTFLPVDRVDTRGAEFSYNQKHLLDSNWDLRFNLAYTRAVIEKNRANPTVEGKDFPRQPRWRANLLATWHINPVLDLGLGLRHASNSFADLDNGDRARRVFGAMDRYTFLNTKLAWQYKPRLRLALGVDNIGNETAYVHHPWPARTGFVEASYRY